MLKYLKPKHYLAAGALAFMLALSPVANADDEITKTSETNETAVENVEENLQNQAIDKHEEVLSEATNAIKETQKAIKALDEENNGEAIKALERATGKLEIILAREPSLALAPSSVSATTYDVVGTNVDDVKALREEAENALKDGRLQEARHMIRNLASELVISTKNIPLVTYPDAIKLAVKHIDAGEVEAAKGVLQTALNTLVVKNNIIPLPILKAEQKLEAAQELAEKTSRNDEENKKLQDLLNSTRQSIELAQALGYPSEVGFKEMYDEIEQIEAKTENGKSGIGLFKKITQFLKGKKDANTSEQSD